MPRCASIACHRPGRGAQLLWFDEHEVDRQCAGLRPRPATRHPAWQALHDCDCRPAYCNPRPWPAPRLCRASGPPTLSSAWAAGWSKLRWVLAAACMALAASQPAFNVSAVRQALETSRAVTAGDRPRASPCVLPACGFVQVPAGRSFSLEQLTAAVEQHRPALLFLTQARSSGGAGSRRRGVGQPGRCGQGRVHVLAALRPAQSPYNAPSSTSGCPHRHEACPCWLEPLLGCALVFSATQTPAHQLRSKRNLLFWPTCAGSRRG